jgi:hypothetical protein
MFGVEIDGILLTQVIFSVCILLALIIYLWYELVGWNTFKFQSDAANPAQASPMWAGNNIVFRECIFTVIVGNKNYSADVTDNLNLMAEQCRADKINPMKLVSIYIPADNSPCPTGSIPSKNSGMGCWTQQGSLHPFSFYIPNLPLTDSFSTDTQTAISVLYGSYRVFS